MDNSTPPEQVELPTPESLPASPAKSPNRLAAWLQFPRRVVLLLIAFGLTSALISALRQPLLGATPTLPNIPESEIDWTTSLVTQQAVAEIISERMPNTLLILGATLVLALILALVAALVGTLAHKLEEATGPPGSILKGLGRLWVFGNATAPVFAMSILLLFIFAVQLEMLPVAGMGPPGGPDGLADRIKHIILPVLSLALLPAALTAQAVTRKVTLPHQQAGIRPWLAGLLGGLGVLLGQIGGLLSGIVLVETIFAWPGIGRMLIQAAMSRDLPMLLGVVSAGAGLALAGRLAAEFFRWLERLVATPDLAPQLQPTQWRKTARKVWVVVALLLLLIPLGLVIAGLATDPQTTQEMSLQARNSPPSPDHPWGTDQLGRDLQARALRGQLTTLAPAAIAALIILLPGGLIGALAGFLASRRVLWAESVADLVLLPVDMLLFIPVIPGAVVLSLLSGQGSLTSVGLVIAVVLLPRAVRVYQTLWTAAPEERKGLVLGLAGLGALWLGVVFAGFGLVAALDFLGLGTPPPVPTLGGILQDTFTSLRTNPGSAFAPAIILWVSAFALYTAADALVGFFHSKEALVRLNE